MFIRNLVLGSAIATLFAGTAAAQVPDNSAYDANYTYKLLSAQTMKGYAAAGGSGLTGLGAAAASGNEFFAPSEYAFDCTASGNWPADGVYSYANWNTQSIGDDKFTVYQKLYNFLGEYRSSNGQLLYTWGFMRTTSVCRTTAMPVVDASFLTTLKSKGYEYLISYPKVDPKNGHALVTWSKAGRTNFGSARLTGAGWVDQYADYHDCIWIGFDKLTDPCRPVTITNRDRVGNVIVNMDAPDVPNGVRLAFHGGIPLSWFMTLPGTWQNAPYNGGMAAQYAAARADWNNPQKSLPGEQMHYHVALVIDPWISGTGEPPVAALPPVPSYEGASDPAPINVGDVSSGAGAGGSLGWSISDRTTIPFDYGTFCTQPARDGTPRSPLWIQDCLARH